MYIRTRKKQLTFQTLEQKQTKSKEMNKKNSNRIFKEMPFRTREGIHTNDVLNEN